MRKPKTAIVHYWLVGMRGGEKVVEALCEMWPDADIFTHVFDPDQISSVIKSHNVQTTFISRLPRARRMYKTYLPLMPFALENLDLSAYDLIISSESGPAKGVVTRPDALHVCYCHSPMRYIWDQFHAYRKGASFSNRHAMGVFGPLIRHWDCVTASRVDSFVANSEFVAGRIRKFYRREATVIHPPVSTAKFSISAETSDAYVAFGELVGYKRFDIAVEACTRLNRRLIVIGEGEQMGRLRSIAGPTVTFAGRLPDAEVAKHLSESKALIFPGEEDFGIIPVEAMASGRPVIAFMSGGACETVVDGQTGILVPDQTVEAFCAAIETAERMTETFDPALIRAHALRFDVDRFKATFRTHVERQLLLQNETRRSGTLSLLSPLVRATN